MRTFEDLLGDTEAYVDSDRVSGPFRRLKRVARRSARLAIKSARPSLRPDPTGLTRRATRLVTKGLAAVTGPVRRRIFRAFFKKLIGRRARLVSWQRRRSLQPLPAEQRQAQRWATAYVRRKGILGKLVGAALSGDDAGPTDLGAEPATAALITASIPMLIQLARRALKTAEREGAPAEPRAASDTATAEPASDEAEPAASATEED